MAEAFDYLVIGSGNAARHFCHYLDLLHIPYEQWSRRNDPQEKNLPGLVARHERILILLSDLAIESFIQAHPFLQNKLLIHFSGCLHTPLAYGMHPLMTLNEKLYDLSIYQKLFFIVEQNAPGFAELLPGLNNPHYRIDEKLKPYYHSLCAMACNFTVILWQKLFAELENSFAIAKEAAYPLLERMYFNLLHEPEKALTGPLQRGDERALELHVAALADDAYQKVYQAFIAAYQAEKR